MNTITLLQENKLFSYEEALTSLLEQTIADELPSFMEAAIKRVNRIRNGKIQRNRRVATDKNYTLRGGRLVRISPVERRHRQLSQRLASRKRRAKMSVALRKRKISLMRRKAFGATG